MINIEREIQGHQKINHPNIIKFYGHQKQGNKVLILLEYAHNGDLFNYLNKKGGFDNPEACKYFTQTAMALQHIHSFKLIHRDLKPENLLLDKNYDIKLCDFGWSAEYDENMRRQTVCGTYEYMAPEILFQKQQSVGIDIWALGILLYELLHNRAPYSGKSMSEVKKKIITSTIKFKRGVDQDAKDLIQKILRVKAKDRMTIDDILRHPYVKKYYKGSLTSNTINIPQNDRVNNLEVARRNFANERPKTQQSQLQNNTNHVVNQDFKTHHAGGYFSNRRSNTDKTTTSNNNILMKNNTPICHSRENSNHGIKFNIRRKNSQSTINILGTSDKIYQNRLLTPNSQIKSSKIEVLQNGIRFGQNGSPYSQRSNTSFTGALQAMMVQTNTQTPKISTHSRDNSIIKNHHSFVNHSRVNSNISQISSNNLTPGFQGKSVI